jgi:hypothetical protein
MRLSRLKLWLFPELENVSESTALNEIWAPMLSPRTSVIPSSYSLWFKCIEIASNERTSALFE